MAMNITDIEDKIIKKSNEAGEDFAAFARRWEVDYFEDMKALGIERPDIITRVSEYVPEIIEFVENLMKNGFGYEANGSVYFDTTAY